MAGKGRPGPRQPLSRKRPKAARRKQAAGGARRSAHATKTRSGTLLTRSRSAAARSLAPARPPRARLREHADAVYARLIALYPNAHCELDHADPWQLLVATILSAQCTDKRVNMVTPGLFRSYPTPAALAAARQEDVEEIIRSTGFFRNKARNLIAMAGTLVERHDGLVPASMDALVRLPGVGRKTANVVLGNACGVNEGVVVDTHVQRLSRRLALSRHSDPVKVEQDLMALFDGERWTMLSHLLIWHGRRLCFARKPACGQCPLASLCPAAGVG